jgi:hypothetical protein
MGWEKGWVEFPQAKKAGGGFHVQFQNVANKDADTVMESRSYLDITKVSFIKSIPLWNLARSAAQGVSAAGLILHSNKAFKEGQVLSLEMDVQGLPMPIKAVAVTMRSLAGKKSNGPKFSASLHFLGIHREDVASGERYLLVKQRVLKAK